MEGPLDEMDEGIHPSTRSPLRKQSSRNQLVNRVNLVIVMLLEMGVASLPTRVWFCDGVLLFSIPSEQASGSRTVDLRKIVP